MERLPAGYSGSPQALLTRCKEYHRYLENLKAETLPAACYFFIAGRHYNSKGSPRPAPGMIASLIMSTEDPRGKQEAGPALAYLGELDDETMILAWGPDKTPDDWRRIVLAATIFGRQFEERMREHPPESLEEKDFQRFLMSLMNAVISEFAEREGLSVNEAGAFLSDVNIRDYVLELNEVLEEFADDPDKPLNEHLKTAVESRQDRARWSRHFSSG